jgi:hypothetical protein
MRVTVTRRTGQNEPGTTLDLTRTEAEWLVHRGYADMTSDDSDTTRDDTRDDHDDDNTRDDHSAHTTTMPTTKGAATPAARRAQSSKR